MSAYERPVRSRSPLLIIFFTILIDMIGFGIVIPVLPLYAEQFAATSFQNGLLVGVFSLAQFIFSPIWGKASDRVGRKPILFVSILGTALGFFMMGAAGSLAMLFVARIIDGISGGNIGTAQAYIADITPPEKRSKSMGLIGAAFGFGFVIGPALGGILGSAYGHSAPMYFAGGLAVVNALLVLFLLPESLPKEKRAPRHNQPISDVFRHANGRLYGTVVATYFLLICGFSMMTAQFALFALHRFGLDAKHTGYLLAMVGIIGVVIQGGLIGRLVKRFGEARLATTGATLLAVSLAGMPTSGAVSTLLFWSAGMAIGNSLLMPTLTGLASQQVDAAWQGRALGVMQSSGSLARWIGPMLAGWLAAFDFVAGKPGPWYGRWPFWVGAALVGVTIFLTLTLPRTRPSVAFPAETSPTT